MVPYKAIKVLIQPDLFIQKFFQLYLLLESIQGFLEKVDLLDKVKTRCSNKSFEYTHWQLLIINKVIREPNIILDSLQTEGILLGGPDNPLTL